MASVVGLREFRLAAEWNRSHDHACFGVNSRGVVRPAIECEHAAGLGLVADGIRVLARGRLADRLQCLQVEDRDVISAAVTNETTV